MSATVVAIQKKKKKNGLGTAALINSNEEIENIMKIVLITWRITITNKRN